MRMPIASDDSSGMTTTGMMPRTPLATFQRLIHRATKPAAKPVLRQGATGDRVRMLQRGLNETFPAYSKLATDSSFGPATERVVREFQRRSGLAVDGTVGPRTQAALAKRGVRL